MPKKTHREIIESNLNDAQGDFRRGRSNTDHISHQHKFEKSWKYAKEVITCLVDLEAAYDRVPREKLWGVLREYSAGGRLLLALKSLYS